MIHLFWLLLSMRGRINFEQLGRYSSHNEGTFRNNFDKPFDFLAFNRLLIKEFCSPEVVIAFDPSFIAKSGKHTPGLGYFWSGCAGRSKKGLEIGGFAAIDILNNTSMHLTAHQTIRQKADKSLLDYYTELVVQQSTDLQKTATTLVVDAYFSKKKFIIPVTEAGFTVVSRLRKDAVLFYPYLGLARKGRGRPKKFAGKVDTANPSEEHFKLIVQQDDLKAFEAVIFSKGLKRLLKVVLVHYLKADGSIKRIQILFSTNPTMAGTEVVLIYKGRFQIEFLYRDAKQHAGLEHCQSRKEQRLHFHFNASLTAVSLAKAMHYLKLPIEKRTSFSMASIKTQYFNELLLDRFISAFGIFPIPQKNNPVYLKLRDFGKIAA